MSEVSRRRFVSTLAAGSAYLATRPRSSFASPAASKFKVAVISDEISDDFDLACSIIARDFGLHWVELRGMWGKNLQSVSDDEIVRAQGILAKYELQVTDIASPLFKVDWPGATKSKYSMAQDLHGAAESTLAQQDEVLARSIALAKRFKANKVRCFDFWRIDDIAEHRPAINDHLRSAAEVARKDGVMLLLENEFECNTATGREAAATLAGVVAPNFALNWDPGNAVMRGEIDAYPGGWDALPKNRIHHCHCKNAVSDDKGGYKWSPVNIGYIDWTKQFRALKELGYNDAVSLETHWRGGGTPEASTRISWAGMKSCLEAAGTL